MKSHFYHHNIWKHVAAFADLFNDMEVYVYDKDRKNAIGRKRVPVILAPKEKVISVLSVIDGAPKPEIDNHLPKMSIIWQGLNWDKERQTGSNHRRDLGIEYKNENGEKSTKYTDRQTIPYILEFQLSIWTVYLDEAVQLLENILPFFHPDVHISLYERVLGTERDAKIELESVTPNFVYELNEPDRRIIQFDLDFTMECMLYRPIEIQGVIEQAFIGIAAVNAQSPNKNEGDVLYVTTKGVSGALTDENIRQAIIAFDEIDNNYTNPEVESAINALDVMKFAAVDALPDGTPDHIVKTITDEYDEMARQLGYGVTSFPFNALQFRRGLIDSMDYSRTAFMENEGLVDPSFPKFYDEGYDEQYDLLDAQQKQHMFDVKDKFELYMYAVTKANEANEYVQSLVESENSLFTPGIGERSADYNYLFDSLE